MTELLSYDREGALERLIPLLREIGRGDAADDLVKREEKAYCTESDTCKVLKGWKEPALALRKREEIQKVLWEIKL